jgi:hypothetical protein
MYAEAEKYFKRELPKRIMGYFTEFLFAAWATFNNKRIYFSKLRFVK